MDEEGKGHPVCYYIYIIYIEGRDTLLTTTEDADEVEEKDGGVG